MQLRTRSSVAATAASASVVKAKVKAKAKAATVPVRVVVARARATNKVQKTKKNGSSPLDSYKSVQEGLRRSKLSSIRLPSLRDARGVYTVGGLMVAFFGDHLGRVVTKEDLVGYLRLHGCQSVDPQPRHLGMQIGLNFLVQGCRHPVTKRVLRQGEYCLLDVKRAHPNHHLNHRARPATQTSGGRALDFEAIKKMYEHRCVCCGSREGEPHLKNKHLLTRLDRGHCDPRLPLDASNCIPMCTTCNMVYKDRAVINKRGFISSWLGIDTLVEKTLAMAMATCADTSYAEDAESFTTCPEDDSDDSDDSDEDGRSNSNSNSGWRLPMLPLLPMAAVWLLVRLWSFAK